MNNKQADASTAGQMERMVLARNRSATPMCRRVSSPWSSAMPSIVALLSSEGLAAISRKTVLLLNGRSEALFLGRCYGRVKDNIWNPSLSRPLAMLAARVQPDVDASALVLILEASSGWASPQTGRYFGSGSTRPLAGESYRPALCNRTAFPSACAAFTTSF